ncbi:amidohydrolase [Citrobacter amalonaticus]|uniref:amidohydrolase n=1 Tax=Citrobacter amalonaticus TaxID=35703 RepID=UPI00300C40FF
MTENYSHHADILLFNGDIHSMDIPGNVHQAIAVHHGRILATGSNEEILPLAGPRTQHVDLQGRTVLPGLIDSHMHPWWGAKLLAGFSLNYESLTPDETVARIQAHLGHSEETADDDWLLVRGWLRIGGSDVTRHDLDRLATPRPVMLFSNDCHFIALNSRGLERLSITKETADPPDGNILRDDDGEPTGILEDAPAMRCYDRVSRLTPEQGAQILMQAQTALHRQGVTTIMDARAEPEAFDAFYHLWQEGKLQLRVYGAKEITPEEVVPPRTCAQAVEDVLNFARKYSTNAHSPQPGISIRQAKFFIDGMLPNHTAHLLEPYADTPETCGHSYFTERQLTRLFICCARAGLHPHMHIIGDGAAEMTLDALEIMRVCHPDADIRPGMAHNDLMASHQYQRFAGLGVTANLSWQWAGLPQGLPEAYQQLLGSRRAETCLETHGKFFDAGVMVAYNSDWPIDPLDEWGNFQVGLTRRLSAEHSRLNSDRNLTVDEVLRATTIHGAFALGVDNVTGSLEAGKFADLIITSRNPFTTPAEEFGQIKVLLTMVGGKVVWQAEDISIIP